MTKLCEAGVAGKIVDESAIQGLLLQSNGAKTAEVERVIKKARELKGLSPSEVALLLTTDDASLVQQMFEAAHFVKEEIYGKRLVLFAPLYYSNYCCNNCLYCGFRKDNKQARRQLTLEEVGEETRLLVEQGHKRILVIAGEDSSPRGFDYLLDVIRTVYATRSGRGEIRRVNVEMAPMTVDQFRRLKEIEIGTYVVFQETYHRETYARVHVSGPKSDYDWRVTAMDRAMQGGVNDVGIGALFGLYDYRFEVLALLFHAQHLERTYGTGPHTISVPRIELAEAPLAKEPPVPVSDQDLKKIVAILRMAVPYTGIILSTRERADLRNELFRLGVSQISAGSKTDPGGYSGDAGESASQFAVSDNRSLDEVIREVASQGYIPSFCTGCYRLRRTGPDFMELAKPGEIKYHCDPNGLSTFEEYLIDYGSEETRQIGRRCIEDSLKRMDETPRQIALKMLEQIRSGKRDVFC